jgi:hypothetical protein
MLCVVTGSARHLRSLVTLVPSETEDVSRIVIEKVRVGFLNMNLHLFQVPLADSGCDVMLMAFVNIIDQWPIDRVVGFGFVPSVCHLQNLVFLVVQQHYQA